MEVLRGTDDPVHYGSVPGSDGSQTSGQVSDLSSDYYDCN